LRVARVAADPARVEQAAAAGRLAGLAYYGFTARRSSTVRVDDGRLEVYAAQIAGSLAEADTWCIFDNTASSAATGDALALSRMLDASKVIGC
jgi:uncharacterized protein YecE (DUF72 family)